MPPTLSLIHISYQGSDALQHASEEAPFRARCERQRPGDQHAACDAGPVSYTHLDVYKRQGHDPYLRISPASAAARDASTPHHAPPLATTPKRKDTAMRKAFKLQDLDCAN